MKFCRNTEERLKKHFSRAEKQELRDDPVQNLEV